MDCFSGSIYWFEQIVLISVEKDNRQQNGVISKTVRLLDTANAIWLRYIGRLIIVINTVAVIEAGIGAISLGFMEAGFQVKEIFAKDRKAINIH